MTSSLNPWNDGLREALKDWTKFQKTIPDLEAYHEDLMRQIPEEARLALDAVPGPSHDAEGAPPGSQGEPMATDDEPVVKDGASGTDDESAATSADDSRRST